MQVRLTDQAEADIEGIGDFIAMENPARAETFVFELVARCLSLGEHAYRFQIAIHRNDREVRRCRHRSYLIFYSVVEGVVEINHVIHQSRDYMRLLFPDD